MKIRVLQERFLIGGRVERGKHLTLFRSSGPTGYSQYFATWKDGKLPLLARNRIPVGSALARRLLSSTHEPCQFAGSLPIYSCSDRGFTVVYKILAGRDFAMLHCAACGFTARVSVSDFEKGPRVHPISTQSREDFTPRQFYEADWDGKKLVTSKRDGELIVAPIPIFGKVDPGAVTPGGLVIASFPRFMLLQGAA